ncbi:MAG: TonB-dependent receptor [Sandaracinaceae bacterium]|nr:TonB-dependent receptor [Sandaracinaceae bacterium]
MAWCAVLAALAPAPADAQPVVRPPHLERAPEVRLPPDAPPLDDGDAQVVLSLDLDTEGRVRDAEVIEGVREDVDALALEAARALVFSPATRDGEPVAARIRFRFVVGPAPPASEEAAREPAAPGEVPAEPDTAPAPGEDELGVTAQIERVEEGAADRVTLRGAELTTVPGTFGEPLRAVATLPGVARSPFGLGFFLVRGSNFQNTGFLVDGFQVPLLYHVGAGPAILSNRFVEELRFYAGNYPVQYGRYSGGLVALDTSIPRTRGPEGEASLDAVRASALAIVPFDEGRGAVAAAFRRSYFELFVPLIQPGLDVAFMDYQVLGRYRVDDHLELSLFFFGANDYLDQSGQIGDGGFLSEGSRSSVSFDLYRLITTARIRAGTTRASISAMVGRDASGFDAAQPGFGVLRFDLEAFFAGWRADVQVVHDEHLRTRVGIDVNTLDARILGTAPVPPGLGELPRPLPSITSSDAALGVVEAFAAAYVEQVFDYAPFELSAGLRLEAMRYGDVFEIVPDPRVVLRLRPHPMVTLKAAGGLFVQQPSPFTIFRVGGNPSIPPERAYQSSGGIELALPFGLEAWLTAFYNRQWNIARGVDEIVPTQDGLRRVFFRADEEGRSFGLEAMVRLRVEGPDRSGFYGWVTYTLSRSERWVGDQAADVFGFDQTHVLNVVASYRVDGWRFGARFSLASGRPARALAAVRFDADTGGYAGIFGPRDERIDYAHQLDVRIDREFDVGPITGSVYLDVMNVYFSELPEGRIYQYDLARSANLRGLPIIPSIGVQGTIR